MRRAESKERSRQEIITAATEIFNTNGFRRAHIRDIAARAGYSSGAIFNHWPTKDALYTEITGRQPPDL